MLIFSIHLFSCSHFPAITFRPSCKKSPSTRHFKQQWCRHSSCFARIEKLVSPQDHRPQRGRVLEARSSINHPKKPGMLHPWWGLIPEARDNVLSPSLQCLHTRPRHQRAQISALDLKSSESPQTVTQRFRRKGNGTPIQDRHRNPASRQASVQRRSPESQAVPTPPVKNPVSGPLKHWQARANSTQINVIGVKSMISCARSRNHKSNRSAGYHRHVYPARRQNVHAMLCAVRMTMTMTTMTIAKQQQE